MCITVVLVNGALNSMHVKLSYMHKLQGPCWQQLTLSVRRQSRASNGPIAYFKLKIAQYKQTLGNEKGNKLHNIPHVNKHKHTSARFTMKHASDTRKKPAFTWFWGAVRGASHTHFMCKHFLFCLFMYCWIPWGKAREKIQTKRWKLMNFNPTRIL